MNHDSIIFTICFLFGFAVGYCLLPIRGRKRKPKSEFPEPTSLGKSRAVCNQCWAWLPDTGGFFKEGFMGSVCGQCLKQTHCDRCHRSFETLNDRTIYRSTGLGGLCGKCQYELLRNSITPPENLQNSI